MCDWISVLLHFCFVPCDCLQCLGILWGLFHSGILTQAQSLHSTQMVYFEHNESQIQSDSTEVCHTLSPGQYPTLANDQVMPRDSSMVKLTLKKISNPNQTSANWSPSGSTHFLEKSCFVEWKRIISWTKHFLSLSSLGLCQLVLQQWLQWKHPQCLQRKEELRGTTFFGVQNLQYVVVCRIDSGFCGISCTLWILNIAIAMNRHACIIYSILYLSIGQTVHVDMLHMPYNFTSARLIFQ